MWEAAGQAGITELTHTGHGTKWSQHMQPPPHTTAHREEQIPTRYFIFVSGQTILNIPDPV